MTARRAPKVAHDETGGWIFSDRYHELADRHVCAEGARVARPGDLFAGLAQIKDDVDLSEGATS